jgi:hypothetical protein
MLGFTCPARTATLRPLRPGNMTRYACRRCNEDVIFPSEWTSKTQPRPLCAGGHPLVEVLDLRASLRSSLVRLCFGSLALAAIVAAAGVLVMHRPVRESLVCGIDFVALSFCAAGNLGLCAALFAGTRATARRIWIGRILGGCAVSRFTVVLLVGIAYLAATLAATLWSISRS